ncbi:B12-binding domain-containing radical SAM protein [Candidatus Omnitrophota bacterium]
MNRKTPLKVMLWRPVGSVVKDSRHTRDIRVPFTLKYIEALLSTKSDFEVRFVDSFAFPAPDSEVIKSILSWSPDVIAICATTGEYLLTIDCAKEIKKKMSPFILALGQDPSAEPERYVFEGSSIDAVLTGESELVFTALAEELQKGEAMPELKGCYSLHNKDKSCAIVEDLDALPLILYSKEEMRRYALFYPLRMSRRAVWGHMLTSRGCPYECTFCSQTIRESYGKKLRFRSPESIIREMRYLKSLGANIFSFADDNFTTKEEHVNKVCEEIIRSGLDVKWTAHARIDNMREPLVRMMKKAGCIQLRFGIESASPSVLRSLRKTRIEALWAEKAQDVFDYTKKEGIATVALFLLGSPGEKESDLAESSELAKRLDPDMLQICFFTAYPGSTAYEELKLKGDKRYLEDIYHYKPCTLNTSQIKDEDLKRLYNRFYSNFYFRTNYLAKHAVRYGRYYINNISVFKELLKTATMLGKG